MLGRKNSLRAVLAKLRSLCLRNIRSTEFCQGKLQDGVWPGHFLLMVCQKAKVYRRIDKVLGKKKMREKDDGIMT